MHGVPSPGDWSKCALPPPACILIVHEANGTICFSNIGGDSEYITNCTVQSDLHDLVISLFYQIGLLRMEKRDGLSVYEFQTLYGFRYWTLNWDKANITQEGIKLIIGEQCIDCGALLSSSYLKLDCVMHTASLREAKWVHLATCALRDRKARDSMLSGCKSRIWIYRIWLQTLLQEWRAEMVAMVVCRAEKHRSSRSQERQTIRLWANLVRKAICEALSLQRKAIKNASDNQPAGLSLQTRDQRLLMETQTFKRTAGMIESTGQHNVSFRQIARVQRLTRRGQIFEKRFTSCGDNSLAFAFSS